MLDLIDPLIALVTIAFGLFGLVAPRYTAGVLDMQPTHSTMGLSEIRASTGGLFVALGGVCLLTGAPWAYAMLGVAYAGASAGRAISMALDRPPQPKALTWFALEAIPAAWLIGTNWPG